MTLPDALVEKAARAIAESWFEAPDTHWRQYEHDARAALEAAAPSLRAEGMDEAKKVAVDRLLAYDEVAAQLAMTAILARAAELGQQKE